MATPMTAARFVLALRAEGCTVRERPGWSTHSRNHRGPWGPVHGVMIHHTGPYSTAAQIEQLCWDGYAELPGPLCPGVIHRTGEIALTGYGRCNHAGKGDPAVLAAVIAERQLPPDQSASTDGNRHFYGFEAVNQGDGRQSWPEDQYAAMVRALAAVCRAHGWKAESVIGHKEWQPGKIDPRGIDMDRLRRDVRACLALPAGRWTLTVPLTLTGLEKRVSGLEKRVRELEEEKG